MYLKRKQVLAVMGTEVTPVIFLLFIYFAVLAQFTLSMDGNFPLLYLNCSLSYNLFSCARQKQRVQWTKTIVVYTIVYMISHSKIYMHRHHLRKLITWQTENSAAYIHMYVTFMRERGMLGSADRRMDTTKVQAAFLMVQRQSARPVL